MKHLTLPLTPEAIASLRAGDEVLLTGWLYTGRRRPQAAGRLPVRRRADALPAGG